MPFSSNDSSDGRAVAYYPGDLGLIRLSGSIKWSLFVSVTHIDGKEEYTPRPKYLKYTMFGYCLNSAISLFLIWVKFNTALLETDQRHRLQLSFIFNKLFQGLAFRYFLMGCLIYKFGFWHTKINITQSQSISDW